MPELKPDPGGKRIIDNKIISRLPAFMFEVKDR